MAKAKNISHFCETCEHGYGTNTPRIKIKVNMRTKLTINRCKSGFTPSAALFISTSGLSFLVQSTAITAYITRCEVVPPFGSARCMYAANHSRYITVWNSLVFNSRVSIYPERKRNQCKRWYLSHPPIIN